MMISPGVPGLPGSEFLGLLEMGVGLDRWIGWMDGWDGWDGGAPV